jgi:hypothetical protein
MRTIIRELPSRSSFLKGRFTVEIGYPWLTYGAIMAIERLLSPEHNVLESGSGGSTIFFSRRCKSVKTYETNPEWGEKVRSTLPNPSNVILVCGEPKELISMVKEEPNEFYDWVIVDSADLGDCYLFRGAMMDEFIPKLKKGGFMVVDNYWRGKLKTFDYSGWNVYTFDDFDWNGMGTRVCVKL